MAARLTVRDESFDRRRAHEWSLDVLAERLSVRDLIRNRIFHEVEDYNTKHPHTYRGLIQPRAESKTNRPGGKRIPRTIDKQEQFELACEAFETGRLLILIGDAQADELDDEFDILPGTAVTFLRMTVIVGG